MSPLHHPTLNYYAFNQQMGFSYSSELNLIQSLFSISNCVFLTKQVTCILKILVIVGTILTKFIFPKVQFFLTKKLLVESRLLALRKGC